MSKFTIMPRLLRASALTLTLSISASSWSAGEQQVVDDARKLGKDQVQTQNSSLKNGSSTAAVSSTNPSYTATPPQAQYYTSKDLASPATAQAADCQAKPNDPVCAGIAVGTAQRPKSTVNYSDPALTGQTVGANPTLILGEIAQTYNACSIGGLPVSAGGFGKNLCTLDTAAWTSHICQKYLSTETKVKYSCDGLSDAAYIAVPMDDGGQIEVRAICDPFQGDTLKFEMHATGPTGACDGVAKLEIDMSSPQPAGENLPPLLIPLHPANAQGCQSLSVFWEGHGCSNKHCSMRFHFVDNLQFKKNYLCSGSNAVHGDQIAWPGTGYYPSDPVAQCFEGFGSQAEAQGRPGDYAIANLGPPEDPARVQVYAFWAYVERGIYQGYDVKGEPHYIAPMSFDQPVLVAVPSTTMVNTCTPYEQITSFLPADGVNTVSKPIVPAMGQIDAPQCVRSSSVCLSGAATKIIDGVPVTKECWNYSNTFECTRLVLPSTCIDPALKKCQPRFEPKCLSDDGAGRCLHAELNLDCKGSDGQYTQAVNCGNLSYCAGGSCYDTSYVPNKDFAYTVSQMEAHAEAGNDFDDKKMEIFKGTDNRCHKDAFGANSCCGGSAPMGGCTAEEKKTVERRDAGKCQAVGEYCSKKVLFTCYEKTETYCCFSSLLARLIQQQGHQQMGKGWGDPKSPDCSGFTPDELAQLDWSAFDLSDFYASISPTLLNESATTQKADDKQNACYWGAGRC